jgi:serine protease Do
MSRALGVGVERGALVGDVVGESPAARAGLARGDVVVSLDGKPIDSARQLRLRIAESAPGTAVHLGVLRQADQTSGKASGKASGAARPRDLTVTLGELPADGAEPTSPGAPRPSYGLELAPLSRELAAQLELPSGVSGVVIAAVAPDSRAAAAGLSRGDVIEQIDSKPVASPDAAVAALRAAHDGGHVLVVLREGTRRFVLLPEK